MTLAALLAVALALPGPYRDAPETAAHRRERVELVVRSAWDAAHSTEGAAWPWDRGTLAAGAVVVTWYEGARWSLRAHRAPWVPDVGGRAACLGQLHSGTWVPFREWNTLGGTDPAATRRCLGAVVRVLSRHAARCRVGDHPTEWQMGRILGAYGTGRCSRRAPRWAGGRAWLWWRVTR